MPRSSWKNRKINKNYAVVHIKIDKDKGKVPPGCLLAKPVTLVTRYSMLLDPCLGTMQLSSALSQLHILCVAQLFLTWSQIIRLRCAQPKHGDGYILIQRRCLFLNITHTHLYRGHIYPNGFHILLCRKGPTYYPQMIEQALGPCSQSDLLYIKIDGYRYKHNQNKGSATDERKLTKVFLPQFWFNRP